MKIAQTLSLDLERVDEIKVFYDKIYINSAEKMIVLDQNLDLLGSNLAGSGSFIAEKNILRGIGNALFKDGEKAKILETADEINEIDINCYKNLVGITDDSGSVTLYNLKSGQISVSKSKHQNIAVPIAFRPTLGRQLCSGGFDSCAILWDADKLTEKLRITFAPRDAQPGCNPPHVHSLCWSDDGSALYAGLGSGDLAVMSIPRVIKSLKTIPISYLSGHSWSVSSIIYVNQSVVISGSIDRCIILWKDGEALSRLNLEAKINTMALYSSTQILVGSTDSVLRVVDFSEHL